jgi:hypothetical protein
MTAQKDGTAAAPGVALVEAIAEANPPVTAGPMSPITDQDVVAACLEQLPDCTEAEIKQAIEVFVLSGLGCITGPDDSIN